MALVGQRIGEAAQDNVSTAMGGVLLASQNLQAIASEFAKLSFESVGNATQVVDLFSKAKSWDQIVDIQHKFLKSSIDTFAAHSAKMAELMASWPREMGKTYQQVSSKMVQAGSETAKAAAEQSGMAADKISAAGEQANEALGAYGGH